MSDQWRVLVPESVDPSGPESISDFATCTGSDAYDTPDAALADIGRYDAVVVRTVDVTAEVLDQADELAVVAKHGTGLDNVDIDAATARNIVVCNTPGANAPSVAEHAIALLLGVRRKLRTADAHVRAGGWDRTDYSGRELRGDTLGLFGCGMIARDTAEIATALGMDVVAYDPYVESVPDRIGRVDDPLSLFERADAVSLHVPATEETRYAVSTEELEALGSDGVLVNTARGVVVDQNALVEALDSGAIGGAGLDVFETEPPAANDPLLSRNDVLLSPHVAGVTDDALERMSRQAAENIRTVYEGGLPESTVNATGLDPVGAR